MVEVVITSSHRGVPAWVGVCVTFYRNTAHVEILSLLARVYAILEL